MNRRRFFAFLGIGAVSVVVPKALATSIPETPNVIDKRGMTYIGKGYLGRRTFQSILPEGVQVDSESFRFMEYLNETQDRLLGLEDLASRRKA